MQKNLRATLPIFFLLNTNIIIMGFNPATEDAKGASVILYVTIAWQLKHFLVDLIILS
jgi:hypothetical protein